MQLLQRVARRARTGDITKLGLTEQLDVLEACNAALQRTYDALPAYFKEQTQGFTLPAPVTLNNVSVTSGSTVVSTGLFSVSQIGQTVLIPGDPQYNQILGTNALRNPYLGASGTVSGVIVYGDAWYSTSYPFDRIIGNPVFTNLSLDPLVAVDMSQSQGDWNWLYQNTVGQPIAWWTQQLGNSAGNQPLMVMKFGPYPDMAYSIKIKISLWPTRLGIPDMQANTTLNVPDQFLEAGLIPMAIQELVSKPVWAFISDRNDEMVDKRGKEAEQFLRNQVADPTAPNNQVYCPLGY